MTEKTATPRVRTTDEAWAVVRAAGFTEADVERGVDQRVEAQRRKQRATLDHLRGTYGHLVLAAGTPVPERGRHGRGPRLTETDVTGVLRVLEASIAAAEQALAAEVDRDEIRETLVRGMARREDDGEHETNLYLTRSTDGGEH